MESLKDEEAIVGWVEAGALNRPVDGVKVVTTSSCLVKDVFVLQKDGGKEAGGRRVGARSASNVGCWPRCTVAGRAVGSWSAAMSCVDRPPGRNTTGLKVKLLEGVQ